VRQTLAAIQRNFSMKVALSKITLVRLASILLAVLWLWIFLDKNDLSPLREAVLFGIIIIVITLLVVEYLLNKRVKSALKLFVYESLLLLALFVLWIWMVGG
jgi:hypothetical protein